MDSDVASERDLSLFIPLSSLYMEIVKGGERRPLL